MNDQMSSYKVLYYVVYGKMCHNQIDLEIMSQINSLLDKPGQTKDEICQKYTLNVL